VAGEPGRLLAATEGGLVSASVVDGTVSGGGAVVAAGELHALALTGAVALAVREDGGAYELVALDRQDGFAQQGALALADAPVQLAVVGTAAVLVEPGGGVRAVPLGGCLLAGAVDCFGEDVSRTLPGADAARSVAALDDVALVGTEGGSVFALGLPTLLPLGRIDLGAPVAALVADDLGFCAALDAADAAAPVIACASIASFPLQDGERRAAVGAAGKVAVAGSRVLAAVGDRALFAPLAEIGPELVAGAGTVLLDGIAVEVAALGDAGLVLLDDGRLQLLRPGRAPHDVVDLAGALGADFPALANAAPFGTAFAVATGPDLFIAVASAGGGGDEAALLHATLSTPATGAVTAELIDAIALPGVVSVTDLLVHAGRAYVASAPLGLLAVDLDPLTLGADGVAPGDDTVSFAAGAVLAGDAANPAVLAATRSPDGVDGFARLDAGALVGVASATPEGVNSAVRAGRFLVAGTFGSGAFLLSGHRADPLRISPVLALPSASDVREAAPTARGVVFADGAGGVVWALLR
jgi:hypothetical protein